MAHTTGSLYRLGQRLGAPIPKDVNVSELRSLEGKKATVEALRRALAHVGAAIGKLEDAALDKDVNLFGRESKMRDVAILAVVHTSEHLGQLIAYARSNGIAPPWSRRG